MAQPIDTTAIQRLVSRARRRIRLQWAFEGAATAVLVSAPVQAAAIFATGCEWIDPMLGAVIVAVARLLIIAAAVLSAARRLDDELVARRIDRVSGLSDRLSTAIAFQHAPSAGVDATTRDLMDAAIRDGVQAAPRANVEASTPFAWPRDLGPAFGMIALVVIAMVLPPCVQAIEPRIVRAEPAFGPPGTHAKIETENVSPVPGNVFLGSAEHARPITVLDWTPTSIEVKIPDDAQLGDDQLIVFAAGRELGATGFKVVDKRDIRYHREDSVALDPDEKAYVESILAELHDVAKRDQVPELEDFAKKLEQLLAKAENGEITKEQLLDALAKAEDALNKNAEPNQADVDKQLADMGKQLATDPVTKDLGEALQKQDLEKAKQELEKLADKLEKNELTPQQKEQLAKKLDQVAKQMEKQDEQQQKQESKQEQQLQQQIQQLEKQAKDAKTDQQKQELERRLEDKKRELSKLQKDQEQKDQSDQRRALKRLQKDMEKAAENLDKPQKDPGDQQDSEQQASQKLKDAARETGKVDSDKRKQASQKKTSSQMDDLREALQRAKQKGNKGPQDPFNKQGKNSDFAQRARGQKSGQGQGQSWKPGQGQGGQGQGSGQGSGAQQGGDTWGVGHDDNLEGDPTGKAGNTKDADVQGVSGNRGGSTRETILSAAQKGFASQGYHKVYADYQRIVEEVMRTEKLPSSYKYYVKRYFAKIHPSMRAPAEDPK
jgi:hypothetical protein